jgi:hypothetical protein
MSRLDYIGRPWVAFDASNKQHRKWFAEFNRARTWGTCPVRFIVPDDYGDVVTLIQQKLITYYVDREFGKKTSCPVEASVV